jgi:uncharacterized membrane protein YsdA (DUF1294 family)
MSPLAFYSLLAAILVAGATFGLRFFLDLSTDALGWMIAYLASLNVVTFAYYGHDKMMAQHRGRRVPELVLHGLALAGGSLGAFAGMKLFRHKSLKGSFRVVFWSIVAVQIVVCVAIAWRT